MLFLIDENIDVSVGMFLASTHDVRYVTNVLGSGARDPVIVRYAEIEGAVLVTGDRPLANRQR